MIDAAMLEQSVPESIELIYDGDEVVDFVFPPDGLSPDEHEQMNRALVSVGLPPIEDSLSDPAQRGT
jgi:hypothetical protein